MSDMATDREAQGEAERTPLLEWISAGVGGALTLGLIGFLGWEAWMNPGRVPPEVEVALKEVLPAGDGFVAEVTAVNLSPETASAVEVEGVLRRGGEEVERSQVTLDYVPGRSEARGGLFFTEDPRGLELELRALGYAEP